MAENVLKIGLMDLGAFMLSAQAETAAFSMTLIPVQSFLRPQHSNTRHRRAGQNIVSHQR